MGVWTYLRHYLNIVILKSVWTQFDLVPYVIYLKPLPKEGQSVDPAFAVHTRNESSRARASGWSGGFRPKSSYLFSYYKSSIFVCILTLHRTRVVDSLILQFVVWYFLIWRIIFRVVFVGVVADERSDDEDDGDDEREGSKKKK